MAVRAAALPPAAFVGSSKRSTQPRVLPILSELLEAQAAVNVFERLAGRTAMIGCGVAAAAELLLPGPETGLFGAWAQGDQAGQFAATGIFMLCCSVGLAARTYRPVARRHHRLLEPVLASMTGGRRSFSGVTQKNVDRGADYVLDSVFTQPFMRANFLEEDRYI